MNIGAARCARRLNTVFTDQGLGKGLYYGARARAGGTCLVAVLHAASVIGCWGHAAGAASVIVCWCALGAASVIVCL